MVPVRPEGPGSRLRIRWQDRRQRSATAPAGLWRDLHRPGIVRPRTGLAVAVRRFEQPHEPGEGIEIATSFAGLRRRLGPGAAHPVERLADRHPVRRRGIGGRRGLRNRRIGGGDAVAGSAPGERALPRTADIGPRTAAERERPQHDHRRQGWFQDRGIRHLSFLPDCSWLPISRPPGRRAVRLRETPA